MYLDSVFMPSLMNYVLKKFGITIETVAIYDHDFLQAKHGLKFLSTTWLTFWLI